MELVKILPEPIQFPSIYDFTFILFGNNGEIRIHVRVFEDEAMKHSKHDLADAKEPKLLAKFKRYFKPLEIYLIEEYYQLDFDQETVVLFKVYKDINKEPDRIAIFTHGDKKFWLFFRKSDTFDEKLSLLTLDEAKRRIAKEMYYNKKQILFVHPEIIGKEEV